MKHLIITAVSGLFLIAGLILVSIPSGWDVAPVINNYFSLQTGLWQNARLADDLSGYEITGNTLDDNVRIERTDRGAPVIHAETYKDAMYALGYATARDRYFQMKLQARMVEGSISDWFGESYAETDKAFLNLGLENAAWEQLQDFSEQNYNLIAAYSGGVNTYINEHFHSAAPVEFKLDNLSNRYWRPVDSMRSLMLLAYRSAFNFDDIKYQQAINHLGPDAFQQFYPFMGAEPEQVDVMPGSDFNELADLLKESQDKREYLTIGRQKPVESNAMMVSGDHTEEGKTLWALDLHSMATLPSHWYEARIVLPDRELHGVTLPGFPGFWALSSDKIAYSLTDAGVDETDWYMVELNSDSTHYRFDDEWKSLETEQYSIGSGSHIETEIQFTGHGPIINDTRPALAFSSVFHKTVVNPVWLENLAMSDSAEDLDLLRQQTDSRPMKLMAGDHNGNGFVGLTGSVPVRPSPVGIKQASQSDHQWSGVIPETDLPVRYLNDNILFTADEHFDDYNQYYLGINPDPAWRYERLSELIEQNNRIDSDKVSDFFTDTKLPFESIEPLLSEVNSRRYDVTLRELTELFQDWDYHASRNSRLPLLMDYFLRSMRRDLWGELVDLIPPSDKSYWNQLVAGEMITSVHSYNEPVEPAGLVGEVILDAYDAASIQHGRASNWNWESLNRLRLEHPAGLGRYSVLDYGNIPRGGFKGTLAPAPTRNSRFAATYRMAVMWDADGSGDIRTYKLGGSSGDPVSRFYQPMISEWQRGELFEVKPFESSKDSFGDAGQR